MRSVGPIGADAPGPTTGHGATPIEVRVWLFGLIGRVAGEREVSLGLSAGATLADVVAALVARYGDPSVGEMLRGRAKKASCCRISVNGRLAENLAVSLPAGASVEIIVLSAYEGG